MELVRRYAQRYQPQRNVFCPNPDQNFEDHVAELLSHLLVRCGQLCTYVWTVRISVFDNIS